MFRVKQAGEQNVGFLNPIMIILCCISKLKDNVWVSNQRLEVQCNAS